jgi:D-aminoacyl-tRNA deacylase
MRAVAQRVNRAKVTIDGQTVGEIGQGFLVYLGVGREDGKQDVKWLADKIFGLRVFSDLDDKFNLSVDDVGGEVLVISQFTLFGDCRKGRRPSFSSAGDPKIAEELYEQFCRRLADKGLKVARGKFAANMMVDSVNDGPVTMLLDSTKLF